MMNRLFDLLTFKALIFSCNYNMLTQNEPERYGASYWKDTEVSSLIKI